MYNMAIRWPQKRPQFDNYNVLFGAINNIYL